MSALSTLKFVHVFCVGISILLFVYRFGRLLRYPDRPLSRPLRVLPHVNDTLLLAAAIGMIVILELNPLATPWLLAKILALLLYIGLGTMCLKSAPGSRSQQYYFVLAVATFIYIVFAALTRQVLPF